MPESNRRRPPGALAVLILVGLLAVIATASAASLDLNNNVLQALTFPSPSIDPSPVVQAPLVNANPSPSPSPTAGATPTPTEQPSPTPTSTEHATPTSAPTPVPAAPSANFTGTIQSDGLTVKWQDLSSGDITTWLWDFGDGTTSNQQNPSHTYASFGDYPVTITVYGPGGQDSRTKTLYLRVPAAAPTANFTGTVQSDGLTVKWQDLSKGDITRWHWDFGDGTTSNRQNPTHTYAAHGDYDVTITVSGPGGRDSRTKVLHLKV